MEGHILTQEMDPVKILHPKILVTCTFPSQEYGIKIVMERWVSMSKFKLLVWFVQQLQSRFPLMYHTNRTQINGRDENFLTKGWKAFLPKAR